MYNTIIDMSNTKNTNYYIRKTNRPVKKGNTFPSMQMYI